MKKNGNYKKVDVYQMVTDRVMEQLEKGIIPWQKPWKNIASASEDDLAISYTTRQPYSYLNQLLLGRNGEWLTFKQVKQMNGNIKKGAKAGMVVFYKRIVVKDIVKDAEGNEKEKLSVIPMLKYYPVFHISDCEGIDTKIKPCPQPVDEQPIEPIEAAENVIMGYLGREQCLKLHNDKPSSRAFYSPMFDEVTVPMMKQYADKDEYYSTLFHELVHSTMTPERMNREEGMKSHRFGSQDYSREELVAELGAAMLCAATGIKNDAAFKNSVAYIQGWVKHLTDDKKAIVWAASRAEKAARFIYNGERPQNTI